MSTDLVRICPACSVHQPPDRIRCDCGALLFGVDLTLPPAADAAVVSHTPDAGDAPLAATPPAAESACCPHEDCGQLNPAGSRVCLYCNRPLNVSGEAEPGPALLQLPSALRTRYHVLEAFKASGAEADILLVERPPREGVAPAPLVAKIYRQGILPSAEVQARIASVDARHRVTVFETGLSDGRAYEVMEYCAYGSLRQRMNGQVQPAAFIADVIGELASALHAVHQAALVHRDLKPENVLLRSEQPLDLVLTDFSTASVIDATQRFTSMARTLMYAAPEALSGVLDAKADYWALGMMLLEMSTGAHPFRGLSDAVILYQLTTRAMDVSGVADARLRQLIGGLLLRDPKRRWGACEISRWLAGDADLPDAVERDVEPGFAQPYAVLGERCTTLEQLAVAFARHWQAGVADLNNGQLLRWFTNVQKDQNAVRLLLELRHDSGLNADEQLLRFILHFAPGIPPTWQGRGIELPALLAQASQALQGDSAAAEWLCQLRRHRVLDTYAAAGNAQMAELAERWNTAAENFDIAWKACVALLRSHDVQTAQAPDPERVVRYDDVVFGQGASADPARPPPATLHPCLLAAAYDPAWVERLRGKLARELATLAVQRPQLADPGDPSVMTPAQLLACQALLPELRKTVEQQARQEALRQQRQAEERTNLQAALQANLAEISMHARQLTFLLPDTVSLRLALREHANLMARIRAHGDTNNEWLAVRRRALRSEPATLRLRHLCDRLSERVTANSGWFSEQTATFGFVALLVARILGGLLFLLATIVGVALWRRLPMLQMVRDIRRLGQSIQPGLRHERQY
ncbi:protein kinase [Azonexus sp.]|jgi:tRNA A-37 threonylcarbamoyl transferase component Bud32|uniref:serine/threonine-protein kinase n=1 Tax=Azonexus sp. TaxID=1872668 RepID=UPI002816A8A6|nr:protein kinase [Azonexus sp.]MDR1994667.1 protein kinase [Azonexus sp.]